MLKLIIAVVDSLVSTQASAEITVKDYEKKRDRRIVLGKYRRNKRIYCEPGEKGLTEENYIGILNKEVALQRKEGRDIEDEPVIDSWSLLHDQLLSSV